MKTNIQVNHKYYQMYNIFRQKESFNYPTSCQTCGLAHTSYHASA